MRWGRGAGGAARAPGDVGRWDAEREDAERREARAAAELPLRQFPLSPWLLPPRSLPGSNFYCSPAQTSCLCRRLPASLSATFLPGSCSLPAARPTPPDRLLPRAPRPPSAPGSLPASREAAFGDVPLPLPSPGAPCLGAGVQHLTTEPRTLPGRPRTLGPRARAGGRTQQVQGAGTRGGALAFRELYYEVNAGGARAFPLRAGGGASAWRSEALSKVGLRGSRMRSAQGGAPSRTQELVTQACCAVQEGGWGLVVKAMGGGLDGAIGGRALTPGPSFAPAGAPRARQSPQDSAAGANSHCTKIGFTSVLKQLKETSGCIGQARPRRANHRLVVPWGVKLQGLFGGQVMGGCGTWWLAWRRTGVTGLTSV